MDTIQLIIAAAAIVILVVVMIGLFKYLLNTAKALLLNAIGGILILLIANFALNLNVPYSLFSMLLCIFGGVPGAIVLIGLHTIGIQL